MIQPFGEHESATPSNRRSTDIGLHHLGSPPQPSSHGASYIVEKKPFEAKLEELTLQSIIDFAEAIRKYQADYPNAPPVKAIQHVSKDIHGKLRAQNQAKHQTDPSFTNIDNTRCFSYLRDLIRPRNAQGVIQFLCQNVICGTPTEPVKSLSDFLPVTSVVMTFIQDTRIAYEYIMDGYQGPMPPVTGGSDGNLIDDFFNKNIIGNFGVSIRQALPSGKQKDFLSFLNEAEKIVQEMNAKAEEAIPAEQAINTLKISLYGPEKILRHHADSYLNEKTIRSQHHLSALARATSEPGAPAKKGCYETIFYDKCGKGDLCPFAHDSPTINAWRCHYLVKLCENLNLPAPKVPTLSSLALVAAPKSQHHRRVPKSSLLPTPGCTTITKTYHSRRKDVAPKSVVFTEGQEHKAAQLVLDSSDDDEAVATESETEPEIGSQRWHDREDEILNGTW